MPQQPLEPQMITIPAGEFIFGTSNEQSERLVSTMNYASKDFEYLKWEKPQRNIHLPDYAIGKTPITVGEFRVFIEQGGFSEPRYWTDEGWQWRANRHQPEYWDDPKWAGDDRLPVVGMSWYGAVAYCRWLSEKTGRAYRLPTEVEWEKAARGTDGRIYPWGDDYILGAANVEESVLPGGQNLQHTRPVGSYPQGASPFGVLDMSGNVYEWCLSKWAESYQHPENTNLNGPEIRAIRGGSWTHNPWYARCARRDGNYPYQNWNYIGFRCVRV